MIPPVLPVGAILLACHVTARHIISYHIISCPWVCGAISYRVIHTHTHTSPPNFFFSLQGKRSSKGLPEPILPDPVISVLIGELDVLVSAIVRYTSVIQRYYIEYLKGAHLTSLRRLIQVRWQ